MKSVEWGEFRIGDLFEKIKVNKLNFKAEDLPKQPIGEYILPCLTSSFRNQGLIYFVPKEGATILKNVISIPSNSDVYRAYFQSNEFTVLSDAYAIRWRYNNIELLPTQYLFAVLCINKVTDLPVYSYKNKLGGWNVVQNKYIKLPVKDGDIDYGFMNSFIAELEAERLSELEAYLSVSGLRDYTLTEEEQNAIDNFDNLKFDEFKVVDIFSVKNSGNILSRDIVADSGRVPYLCASTDNNAVSSYISYDEKYIDKGNCIFIGGKTFVVTYQENDFYSNDSHNLILHINESSAKDKLSQLYLATCINRSLGYKYTWGDSISKTKIQKDMVSLPIKGKNPNYTIMNTFISAIQKLVIKDVVLYANEKITATRKVVLL